MTGKLSKNLKYYIKKISSGAAEDEKRFISEYYEAVCIIIRHDKTAREDPYIDKFLPALAKKALQAFITNIKNGEIYVFSNNEKTLREIVKKFITKGYIKEVIDSQLRQICQNLSQGTSEAEKKIWDYEINVLNIIEKRNKKSKLCLPNHTEISQKVIRQFIAYITKVGVNRIGNFHSLLNDITYKRTVDQHKKHHKLVFYPPNDPDNYLSNKINKIGSNNSDSYNQAFDEQIAILPELEKEFLDALERYILKLSYGKEKKTLKQIAELLSVAKETGMIEIKQKIDEPFICKKRKDALKKLRKGFNQQGIYTLRDK